MERIELGRTGERVSAVGIGTWQWGSSAWGWNQGYRERDVEGAFERALQLGINFFDTAEIYGGGRSEELLGKRLRGRRDDVFIATKVLPSRITAEAMERAANASLRRLGIDVIDLYQLHFPNPVVPIARLVRGMERLVKQGKVRYLGVSNVGVRGLQRAREALASHDIVSDQVRYNLLQRGPEDALLPYAQRERVTIIAYSPLAQGLLTGKYSNESPPRDLARSANYVFAPRNLSRVRPALSVLERVGSRRGKTPAQVALNWLLFQPSVLPIPGSKRASHVDEAAGAADWRLTEAEWAEIDSAFRLVRPNRWVSLPWLIGRSLRAIVRRPQG